MAYKDRVQDKIKGMGQRTAERIALWQAISESFQTNGAEGIGDELVRRMKEVRDKFNAALAKLEAML